MWLGWMSVAGAADYTCDGRDDLAIGVPYEADIAGVALAGGVAILRDDGNYQLTGTGDVFVHQDLAGVTDANAQAEYFGMALAAGDIDGDGCDDLIVGGSSENVGSLPAGAIWRLEFTSTATAMTVATSQSFSQDTAGVSGGAESYDEFGHAVVSADFDGDGYDDVVVGAPGEDIGAIADAGAIHYLRGSASGLTTTGELLYHQDSADVAGAAESGDGMGEALAAGDFDGDGYADLAVGMPDEDWVGSGEGAVQVFYGSATGPTAIGDEQFTAGHDGAAGTLENGNECGAALAVGDFDRDDYDDLAIGCPGYDVDRLGLYADAGAVLVLYGSSAGLTTIDAEFWSPWSYYEEGMRCGTSLAAGDFDTRFGGLAVGCPFADSSWDDVQDGGRVVVLEAGYEAFDEGNIYWTTYDPPTPEAHAHFGWSLAAWQDDLAVGSPEANRRGLVDSGGIDILFSLGESFDQDTTGVDDTASSYDRFGFSLH